MTIREPKKSIVIPSLEQLTTLSWHHLQCELVTPLYGGEIGRAHV